MSRIRTSATAAVVVAVVVAMSQQASAETSVKTLMGENFSGLQVILYALISGDYKAVPGHVDVISEHAEELKAMADKYAKGDRDQFMIYAMSLMGHANDMKSISQTLMQHDAERPEPGYDDLREALAAHYGGMVTTCVTCHNRFRPQVVSPAPAD